MKKILLLLIFIIIECKDAPFNELRRSNQYKYTLLGNPYKIDCINGVTYYAFELAYSNFILVPAFDKNSKVILCQK